MSVVENFAKKDPFAVDSFDDDNSTGPTGDQTSLDQNALDQSVKDFTNAKTSSENSIHLRVQQRNGRKALTTVEGLPSHFNLKKTLKIFKTEFACNGSIIDDDQYGKVIQLQGDHRKEVKDILIEDGIEEKSITVHGH